MHPVKLTLQTETQSSHTVEGELDDQEWELLEAYIEYVEELFATSIMRKGFDLSLRMDWTQNTQELRVVSEIPSDEDISVLLHKLRPFLLERESTYFMTVSSILGRNLSSPVIRTFLKQARQVFEGRQLQSMIRMIVNDELMLNSDQALDMWLNAFEYHRDRRYRQKLTELTQMATFEGARTIFLMVIVEKIKAIQGIATLVACILGKQTEVQLSFRHDE